jgi:NTP pyrophosphatase (non-canonical NTP hydrolase)
MKMSDYQVEAAKTAIYPAVGGHSWVYPALGLTNEAGEVNGKLKKIIRDSNGVINEAQQAELAKELGDVLWYVAQLATELGIDLDQVAGANIAKLESRQQRGKIMGSGDNR